MTYTYEVLHSDLAVIDQILNMNMIWIMFISSLAVLNYMLWTWVAQKKNCFTYTANIFRLVSLYSGGLAISCVFAKHNLAMILFDPTEYVLFGLLFWGYGWGHHFKAKQVLAILILTSFWVFIVVVIFTVFDLHAIPIQKAPCMLMLLIVNGLSVSVLELFDYLKMVENNEVKYSKWYTALMKQAEHNYENSVLSVICGLNISMLNNLYLIQVLQTQSSWIAKLVLAVSMSSMVYQIILGLGLYAMSESKHVVKYRWNFMFQTYVNLWSTHKIVVHQTRNNILPQVSLFSFTLVLFFAMVQCPTAVFCAGTNDGKESKMVVAKAEVGTGSSRTKVTDLPASLAGPFKVSNDVQDPADSSGKTGSSSINSQCPEVRLPSEFMPAEGEPQGEGEPQALGEGKIKIPLTPEAVQAALKELTPGVQKLFQDGVTAAKKIGCTATEAVKEEAVSVVKDVYQESRSVFVKAFGTLFALKGLEWTVYAFSRFGVDLNKASDMLIEVIENNGITKEALDKALKKIKTSDSSDIRESFFGGRNTSKDGSDTGQAPEGAGSRPASASSPMQSLAKAFTEKAKLASETGAKAPAILDQEMGSGLTDPKHTK